MDKKKIKTYKKLSAEALQELLRIRRKGYISKNKKAYNRKEKHKIVQYIQIYFCAYCTISFLCILPTRHRTRRVEFNRFGTLHKKFFKTLCTLTIDFFPKLCYTIYRKSRRATYDKCTNNQKTKRKRRLDLTQRQAHHLLHRLASCH